VSIVKNTFVGFATTGLLFVIGIISTIVISRWLGPTHRGIYTLFLTVNLFLTSLGSLGIGLSNTVYLGKGEDSLSDINSVSMLVAVAIGGAMLILYFFFSSVLALTVLKGVKVGYVYIAILALPLTLYMLYWNAMMVGLNELILLNKVLAFVSLFKMVLDLVVLIGFNMGVKGLVFSFVLSKLVSVVIILYLLRRSGDLQFSFNYNVFSKVIRFGLRGYFGGVASLLWQRLDMFLLNFYQGPAAVGIYSLAVDIAERLWALVGPVQNAVYPRITKAPMKEAISLTIRTTRHIVFLLIISASAIFFISDPLIDFVFGVEFHLASLALKILLLGTACIGIAMITSVFFIGQLKRPGLLSILAWINVFINVGFCLFLLPTYGVIGAAMASLFTYLIGIIIVLSFFMRFTNTSLKDILVIRREDFRDYKKVFAGVVNRF
jgi:O-antigen/teichoic acid export membrane protein